MEAILILIIIVLVIVVIQKKKKEIDKSQGEIPKEEIPFMPYKKNFLLTKTEYSFYKVLKEQCDKNNLLICPKVRLEDFIKVTDKENPNKYRNYIKSRHIDFLICDSNLYIIAAIELDDDSHNRKSSQKTDEFKNNLFKTITLPLFRIKVNDNYIEKINDIISSLNSNV